MSFICLFSGYPESFPTPDHTADTICHLIDEIIPRHSCPQQIITDNAPEMVGETFEETLRALDIEHIKSTPFCPTSNGLIEKFNGTIKNIIAKYSRDSKQSWDLAVPQSLAAYRFSVNSSTGYSPHYLAYLRDPLMPLDNILRPRKQYMGEAPHRQMLERQHQVFLSVRHNLRKSRARQKEYADRGPKNVSFGVGQAVYYKNSKRANKMDKRWFPYYRITAQLGNKTYLIRNQLTGELKQAHSKQLQKAHLSWKVPKLGPTGRPVRKSTLAKRLNDSTGLSS